MLLFDVKPFGYLHNSQSEIQIVYLFLQYWGMHHNWDIHNVIAFLRCRTPFHCLWPISDSHLTFKQPHIRFERVWDIEPSLPKMINSYLFVEDRSESEVENRQDSNMNQRNTKGMALESIYECLISMWWICLSEQVETLSLMECSSYCLFMTDSRCSTARVAGTQLVDRDTIV